MLHTAPDCSVENSQIFSTGQPVVSVLALLVVIHIHPDALTGVHFPLARHEVVVRRREALVSLSRSGAHVASLLSSVKAGVSHGVGGGPGRRGRLVAAPGQTVGVGPAVPVVALPVLPPRQAAHLLLLALQTVVAVVVLERRRTHRTAVVLPLRLAQQLLLQHIIVQPVM